jgi:phytoene dehydrogenase-like protein
VTGRPLDAVVVGSGPNGLAAALTLAGHGLSVAVLEASETVGGGMRSAELTLPGLVHDVCSAIHPFAVASPYLRGLPLEEHGLAWCWPEVDLVHPIDGGRAGVLVRSLDETADGLGDDGPRWRSAFEPLVAGFDDLADEVLQPIAHVPRRPIALARFGLSALQPATLLTRSWRTDEARGLLAGLAAHAFQPLDRPTTAAIGLVLGAAAHRVGWPVARGGSQAIADAMASLLLSLGGTIETGVRVRSAADLPPARITVLDLAPGAAADVLGDRLPPRVGRALRRYRHGPAAFKVDLAVEGGVPWTAKAGRRAGSLHLGGTVEEISAAERQCAEGRMPERPFVLVGQQAIADPSRAKGDVQPVWAYAHVPHGYDGDATDAVLDQVERFAPGTRERVLAIHTSSPAQLAAYNPNYVGGDIGTGANDPLQLLLRPRLALDPYSLGAPGAYICSAATPPGAGVHGMCGHLAALSAVRDLRRGEV